ncbi:MAG: 1-acyl-sn-glycerol-3-phosphate acyltransferase [Chloroflexi bacterium]|nr:1-acyl-sn-glycerol-3-phosphate acyltransferase [Chloroflexota bacterium]
MTFMERLVNATFKTIVRILCRIDASQLHKVPSDGPILLIANHINFLEVPIMYTHLMPRPLTAFVKSENWERPFLRWLFELWNGIPLHRGEADMVAIRRGLAALEAGKILVISPEGTRSGDGRLQKAHPGIVIMALKSGAPILPVAYWGSDDFWRNLPRLRRTDFHIAVGRPFRLDAGGERVNRKMRQQMADEIMFQIASLLPPPYRGYYADLSAADETYLRFTAEK